MKLAAAGNVEVPAFLVLQAKGYSVECTIVAGVETWTATRGNDVFIANSPLQLLGVVVTAEIRGQRWSATDQEIDAFVNRFYPGPE